jgi:hypothetical protein
MIQCDNALITGLWYWRGKSLEIRRLIGRAYLPEVSIATRLPAPTVDPYSIHTKAATACMDAEPTHWGVWASNLAGSFIFDSSSKALAFLHVQ